MLKEFLVDPLVARCCQALSCAQPQQMLQVTLNHSETLKKMVPNLANVIDTVIEVGCWCLGVRDTS